MNGAVDGEQTGTGSSGSAGISASLGKQDGGPAFSCKTKPASSSSTRDHTGKGVLLLKPRDFCSTPVLTMAAADPARAAAWQSNKQGVRTGDWPLPLLSWETLRDPQPLSGPQLEWVLGQGV